MAKAKWSKLFKLTNKHKKPISPKTKDTSGEANNIPKKYLDKQLGINIQTLQQTTGNSDDIVIRKIELGINPSIKAAVIVTDGLVDDQLVSEFIITTLLEETKNKEIIPVESLFDRIEKKFLTIANVSSIYAWDELFPSLLAGEAIILIDGLAKALSTSTRGGEKRSITEPTTELSIRGPKDSFTESIRTNTSLIRRRINNPNLWLHSMKIGKVTQTDIAIMYINGIANDKIVEEVKRRLNSIEVDEILETGYIEQFIEDETFTTFPTIYHTERPDVVASNLMEGKIAIVVDGTPFVLTVPALFIEFFQVPDDYYSRFDISIAIRFLRVLVFFISLIAPATYIAVTTFHQEMVPTQLIIAIAAQREAVPFPAFVEAMLMEITFEILREAGVRLPRSIGQAVSIVGALVIGQAAVDAGIVSPAMVIVVSITAIASFATPSFAMAISVRIIRFSLMFLAAFMGFYGIIFGLMIMTLHLCSLRSFGIPYMAPFAPIMAKNLGDSLIRLPLWKLKTRPKLISQKNITRTADNQKPTPPTEENNS
ncbi:spore germination protein [Caldibacillus lycopersici]|uniref:Spore germination protein n=1 Tax=Perspicuibacillus lycopersici TaxID=1325689 RepID=A0AAE3IQ06_9BACI|nr:spore germination protein [Perspicuibacillus lycopersici]MCU9612307.1 spore germination protein [Perspicuibacillus lycopersici]